MAENGHLGLRERKKVRTRETIRREAFRLFERYGFANTTVERIAEAADVSPSTFFRYYPSKEALVRGDDLSGPVVHSLTALPADLPPAAALRRALTTAFAELPDDQWEQERTRQRLVLSDPALHGVLLESHWQVIKTLGAGIAKRVGRDPEDFEVRVFSGAVAGAMLGAMGDEPMTKEQVLRALDFLEAGMPLTAR
ncbi:TetR family transcriptional regulator [Mycobacterium sp. MYCO198283]|uniref:acyl-CoA-like ligand-binding transcription factor n=1 Tax=Mycobacterium sp. MYCO198283 TaxID=2883505 RepID=UPI001E34BC5D|nr:TetR family transcriptional regulator [Mycobacterium sp. MYCO198283]MCG5432058.1 TetR family transcriptional regulator [Mycobacterium sp. MYCO198283]